MPFTPFHLGPGMALKACGGKHLSLIVFGFTQVLMDVEPLIHLWRDDTILHGLSHTYLGATVIGLVSILLGRPLGLWAVTLWNRRLSPAQYAWLALPSTISWSAACSGALLGSYSHLLLDSVRHADMRPWAPFASTNGLLYAMSYAQLQLFCLLIGPGGMFIFALVYIRHKSSTNSSKAKHALESP
jgi:hypothetical protein